MTANLKLLRAGISASHKRQYAEAVEALETFCRQNTAAKPKEYFEAQRWLIKAYQQTGQVDLAIYLCRQASDAPQSPNRAWAKSNLQWLEEEARAAAREKLYPPTSLQADTVIQVESTITDSIELDPDSN
jgi:lipopolysaccharide biosynthesis regulator YciM